MALYVMATGTDWSVGILLVYQGGSETLWAFGYVPGSTPSSYLLLVFFASIHQDVDHLLTSSPRRHHGDDVAVTATPNHRYRTGFSGAGGEKGPGMRVVPFQDTDHPAVRRVMSDDW
jgi:hypothetical protein